MSKTVLIFLTEYLQSDDNFRLFFDIKRCKKFIYEEKIPGYQQMYFDGNGAKHNSVASAAQLLVLLGTRGTVDIGLKSASLQVNTSPARHF